MNKTKKILMTLVATLLVGTCCYAQQKEQPTVTWYPINQAATNNPKQTKMYFVDFYTSWCGWCKKMDNSTFMDPVVAAILNQYYVPIKFNAEGNETVAWAGNTYAPTANTGKKGTPHPFTRAVLGAKLGYPSFAIFNEKQGLVTILQGYQHAYDFSVVLWYLCSGDSDKYTFDKYQQIFDQQIKPGMMKKLGLAR